jgi:hypothetical protein
MINEILRERPDDPYGLLALIVQKQSSPEVTIKGIRASETLSSEGVVNL